MLERAPEAVVVAAQQVQSKESDATCQDVDNASRNANYRVQ